MPYYRCAACGLTSYGAAAHSTAGVCPNCSASLADSTRLDVSRASDHSVARVMACRPQAAAEARRTVTGLPLPRATRDPLLLLVSELVTNAVLHSGAAELPIELAVTVSGRQVRVEVHDHGVGFEVPASPAPHPLPEGGQGLLIVDGLADAWGVDRSGGGCTVWCELPVDGVTGDSFGRVRGVRQALRSEQPADVFEVRVPAASPGAPAANPPDRSDAHGPAALTGPDAGGDGP